MEMKRMLASMSILCCVLLVGTAFALAEGIAKENPGVYGTTESTGRAVLYDQTDGASGNGVPDQDFEAAYDAYDSEAADDFVVPAEGWSVETVTTVGTYTSTGTSGSIDVTIAMDAAGVPGAPVAGCVYPDLVPTTDTGGSYVMTLAPVCVLPAGTYWLVMQSNLDYAGGAGGQHFWSNRTATSNGPARWQNPNDGFGSGCTTWTDFITCGIGGSASADLLFTLEGTVLPVELMSFNVE